MSECVWVLLSVLRYFAAKCFEPLVLVLKLLAYGFLYRKGVHMFVLSFVHSFVFYNGADVNVLIVFSFLRLISNKRTFVCVWKMSVLVFFLGFYETTKLHPKHWKKIIIKQQQIRIQKILCKRNKKKNLYNLS